MMRPQKINLGHRPRHCNTIEECKTAIRHAHDRGCCSHLKIKDYDVIRDYCVAREQRRRGIKTSQQLPLLADRLRKHLIRVVPNDTSSRCSVREGYVVDYDPARRLWVIQDNDELVLSQKTWYYHAAWLCGKDDGHYFTHRVPAGTRTIDAAIDWVTPTRVKAAIAAGKQVLRQGDCWFVEHRFRDDDTRAIPRGHSWDPDTRDCTHSQHGTLHVPYNFRAYANRGITGGAVD